MKVQVQYHGRCFDGVVSAALFTAFYRSCITPRSNFVYTARFHCAGSPYNSKSFTAPVNAVVDFRYSDHPNLHWWFDHHLSSFGSPEERRTFETRELAQHVWDTDAPSCAGLIARVAEESFGFDTSRYQELIEWADMIDAANFPNVKAAIDVNSPAIQVMTWICKNREFPATNEVIRQMARGISLEELAEHPKIVETKNFLKKNQKRLFEWMYMNSKDHGGVVAFDLSKAQGVTYDKFVPYYLFPKSHFCVLLSRSSHKLKITVGVNPWNKKENAPSMAKICESYGGGGHADVGAFNLPLHSINEALQTLDDIVHTLKISCRKENIES